MTTTPPFTDDDVETALRAWFESYPERASYENTPSQFRDSVRPRIRAVLDAVVPGILARETAATAERIAVAIEAVRSPSLSVTENGLYEQAARIARWHSDSISEQTEGDR